MEMMSLLFKKLSKHTTTQWSSKHYFDFHYYRKVIRHNYQTGLPELFISLTALSL